MITPFIKLTSLAFLSSTLWMTSCKPIDEDDSDVKADAASAVAIGSVEQFNLAKYVATNNIGGTNLKNNVKAGNAYLYFSSNEQQKVDATNAAELKKSANKAKLSKAIFELRTNVTLTSNAAKSEMKSIFFLDAILNGTKVYASGNTVEAEIIGSAKNAIALKGTLTAFGKSLYNATMLTTKPFKITKSIDLEYKQTVLGIPKLAGIEAGVAFVAAASISGETDYLTTEGATISFVPDVKVTAGIQGTIKALLFTNAKAAGTVTVLDASFPSSASLGGRNGSGADYLYGNVTYDGGSFTALKGEIVIGASASTKGILPKGVEPALWTLTTAAQKALTIKVPSGLEWTYTVWDSPPLVTVKFPAYYTHSFLVSSASKAACAKPIVTKALAAVTTENGKDTGELKVVGKSSIVGLKAILAKSKSIPGTCTLKK